MRYLALTLLVVTAACSPKRAAIAPPPAAPQTPASPIPAEQPRPVASAPAAAVQPAVQAAAPQSRYPDAATRAHIDELLGRIQDAYFDYNRHTLRDDAVKTLTADARELAGIMSQYPEYQLQVEGYCDERGSSEYNLALGEARAKAAKDFLVSSGVRGDQLSTVSFGKEVQLCQEQDEACWAKNRRVHIMALKR